MAKKGCPALAVKRGRFYFRLRIPKELKHLHDGKTEVCKPLGDVSKAQASVMAKELLAKYALAFAEDRHRLGLASAPAPAIAEPLRRATTEEVTVIAKGTARELLIRDEQARTGIDSDEWQFSQRPRLAAAVKGAIAEGELLELWHDFYFDLKKHGRSPPQDMTEKRAMLRLWAGELGKALQAAQQRDQGLPIETPEAPPQLANERIRDAYEVWKNTSKRDIRTERRYLQHITLFEQLMGDPPLRTLTRPIGFQFRDRLQQWAIDGGRAASYANDILASVKTITNVAYDRGMVSSRVLDRMTISDGGKEEDRRVPWEADDLVVLFDSPLYTAYQLPQGSAKAGRDAAYWIPLIAAYTGARPAEMCQLWTDDVAEQAGGLVIEFRANKARAQKLKNKGSWRAVPVHSELMRLGFGDYWQAIKKQGVGPLFPHIPTGGEQGAAGQFGNWFGRYKRSRGFGESNKTLYSFRHTVITTLTLAAVPDTLRRAISGHEGHTVHEKTYASTVRLRSEELRPHIEKLRYAGLTLQRVYHPR